MIRQDKNFNTKVVSSSKEDVDSKADRILLQQRAQYRQLWQQPPYLRWHRQHQRDTFLFGGSTGLQCFNRPNLRQKTSRVSLGEKLIFQMGEPDRPILYNQETTKVSCIFTPPSLLQVKNSLSKISVSMKLLVFQKTKLRPNRLSSKVKLSHHSKKKSTHSM